MNLIVTCPRHFERETRKEIEEFLRDFGDENPNVSISNMSGILTVETSLDCVDIVRKVREQIIDEPWSIRYCRRIIPIQMTVSSDLESISSAIINLVEKMKMKGTYRISIEKRNSDLSSKKIISDTAPGIENKVSLEKPDWIVLIEILGTRTGISIVKNNEIVSVEKIKRSLSE